MIIVKLMGGMGNQMFQYAFAKSIAESCGVDLKLDKSFLRRRDLGFNFVYRNYDLDIFNISSDEEIDDFKSLHLIEPHFHYSKELHDYIKNLVNSGNKVLLEGYWQSSRYFEENDALIRQEFTFKNKVDDNTNYLDVINDIESSDSVMINVRRTDYLKTDFHGVMGVEYIDKAKEIIRSKIKNPKFFIFSDDVGWCKDNLGSEDSVMIDHTYAGNKFEYYIQLMSKCKHFIIPNSTFAWWSVYFNNTKDKIVIAPKKWFSDTKNINVKDIYEKDWITI